MNTANDEEFEVIFDPISKGAVVRNGKTATYLNGPFRTFADAQNAAYAERRKAFRAENTAAGGNSRRRPLGMV